MKNIVAMTKTMSTIEPETRNRVNKIIARLFENNKEPLATVDLCEPGQVKIKIKLPKDDKNKRKEQHND